MYMISHKEKFLEDGLVVFEDSILKWGSDDVAIVMDSNESTYYNTDQRTCFGKILLLGEFYVNNSLKTAIFAFAMMKWYDYCEPS
ncbi:4041_t:CDS:2 [Gigaspora rosea]|nr:4041_t:CDS:2 [Gigaspora rosea]